MNQIIQNFSRSLTGTALGVSAIALFFATPAIAHHPFGGQTPSNLIEGFLSGLGHPVIGIDHFAFVVAVGLVAALKGKQGLWMLPAFILATIAGTALHLMGLDVPLPEIMIAASVVVFGGFLALKNSPPVIVMIAGSAIAGIFHGYAYGEAIIGAEMTPVIAYLSGFAFIQGLLAFTAYKVAQITLKPLTEQASTNLRFAGFTLTGAGLAFLSSNLLG